ncbi:MAG TPA: hypothetical protein VL093_04580 [Flavipsychrobacter sp.]|nr:hypothetical protein [Flavipsychrobacter sp.]
MRPSLIILLLLLTLSSSLISSAQHSRKIKGKRTVQKDSVLVPRSQASLFISPKKNLLTTHVDIALGAGRVMKKDKSAFSFAASVKGLYMLTGVLYVNMGVGMTQLNSVPKDNPSSVGKNNSTIATLPIGVGFTMGDDRAQIINGLDFFPVYYVDHPAVKRARTFTYGVGVDLGFHIRIRQRLHLGMMGKLQLFKPFDKDEHQGFPRYGFVGAGLLLRYD